jgi:hypothetical protein
VEGLLDVGQGEKSKFKKDKKFPHKKAHHEGEWSDGQNISNREKPKQFQSSSFKRKINFVKKRVPLKGSQPKGDISGKAQRNVFQL